MLKYATYKTHRLQNPTVSSHEALYLWRAVNVKRAVREPYVNVVIQCMSIELIRMPMRILGDSGSVRSIYYVSTRSQHFLFAFFVTVSHGYDSGIVN